MAGQDFVREVYDVSYRRLVAQLLALCGDREVAEDAVQEAFVKAIGQGARFSALDNPEAWLRTVALNHLRNRWRRSKLWSALVPKLRAEPASRPPLSPDHVAVVEALRRIPEELREVVALHHIADLPVTEIAQTLGIPEGTVKTRLTRGRARLAELLTDHEGTHHG
ncbi:MAG: RNA polymerase sigma factor [Nocardioidaceae bacterium]